MLFLSLVLSQLVLKTNVFFVLKNASLMRNWTLKSNVETGLCIFQWNSMFFDTSIVKNMFGFTIHYWYNLQGYWQVLQTSTDPDQQFSAPFKAGNSRQVQTCYKPTVQRQRKLQHFLLDSATGEMGVLMTLNHWASMQRHSPLWAHKHFHFWQCISFCVLSWLSETMLLSHYLNSYEYFTFKH